MLYIAICDDQEEQRGLQKEYLKIILGEQNRHYTLYEYDSGEALLDGYKEQIDIIFLDIQMKALNGMQVARQIRTFNETVKIIFTTVIWDYIREGYEVKAFRYLIKPLKFEEYKKEVGACLEELKGMKNYFVLNLGTRFHRIQLEDILYIETADRRLNVHTKKEVFSHYAKMNEVEKNLEGYSFYRCHTGYLVNIRHITRLEPGEAILNESMQIPISKHRMRDLKKRLLDTLSKVIE